MNEMRKIRKKKLIYINIIIVSILCLTMFSRVYFSTTKLFAKTSLSLKLVEDTINENELFYLEVSDERTVKELTETLEEDVSGSISFKTTDLDDTEEEVEVSRNLKLLIPEGISFDVDTQRDRTIEERPLEEQPTFMWDEPSRQLTISMDVSQTSLQVILEPENSGEYTFILSDESNSIKQAELQFLVGEAIEEHTESNSILTNEIFNDDWEINEAADNETEDLNIMEVSSWEEFTRAVADTSVNEIRLQSNITRTATTAATAAGTITRPLTIEGNGYTINFNANNGGFTLGSISEKATVTLKNLTFVKAGSQAIFNSSAANSNNWEFRLENIHSGSGNVSGLINAPNAAVAFTGGNSTYNLTSSNTIFIAKEFYAYNQSQINITTSGRVHESSVNYSVFKVTESSKLNWSSSTNAAKIWGLEPLVEVSGLGTEVNISTTITGGADNSGFYVGNGTGAADAGAVINLLDNAKFTAHATRSSALIMRSQQGTFNIDGNSTLSLTSEAGNSNYTTLRFRNVGDYTFNIMNNSKVIINKNSGTAPGIRMYGDRNAINVKSGSSFEIRNKGNGSASNGGSNNSNQGIQYQGGNNQSFNLQDAGSKVEIVADFGAAIDMMGGSGSISSGEGTIFYAEGRTSGAAAGIFNTAVSTITLNSPEYFDFRNNRPAGGNIYNVSAASTLTATNTNFAVWANGTSLNTDPLKSWSLLDFSLTGSNFSTIRSTNFPDEFNNSASSLGSSGLPAYSRISANNSAPIVDELRVPTTADKNIFGHVSIPEGNIGMRSAWDDEVMVTVELTKANGAREIFEEKTIGLDDENPGVSIYGEEARGGIFQIQLDEFLSEGDKVQVLSAIRGEGSRGIESSTEDIQVGEVVTFPIIPPTPAHFDSEIVMSTDTSIQGHSESLDVEITATHNGQPIDTSDVSIDNSGNFEISLSDLTLTESDEIQVFLRDNAGSAAESGVINPPTTNNSVGNINPSTDFNFHDTTFAKAATLTVNEVTDAILTVEFVNEIDQLLSGYTIAIAGQIGDEIDLTKEERVVQRLDELMNAGYEISERPVNETAVVLNTTEVTVQYKLQGVLSLASTPKALDFGSLTYDATTKRVEDPSIDQPLIVTDTRANIADGWTLTASLSTPMRNSEGQELINALRYVYGGQETILDTNAQTVYLSTDGSAGSFEISNSWGTQIGTDGVKLQIGSSDIVHTGSYTGVITWKVMAGQP
ncbi:pectate lyase-like adhesive domain-containing protein [Enterococcus sp. 5H]|uniref:pectate lyase-like adhesive domain-containing protein n=1 Tax=Enterococcus sp. 5H TaxID=1229490 RepID=UPI002304823B|nr:pectate lyase-like adhesive domain-containing protein [Enterococcus sp. 5H]MDA9472811.1 Adhesion exoprotein [Enterococcus sp. 5H]